MDDADSTSERDVAEAPARLAASWKPEAPQPNGRCHYCDEIVGDYDRWCDVFFRSAWERDTKLRSRK